VLAELDRILELWTHPFIELADDNSFVDRAYWLELLPESAKRHIRWFTETDISIGEDGELLDLLRASGCAEVLIGVESRGNWKMKRLPRYREALRAIRLLFWFAGLYDGLLGAAFLIAPAALFGLFRVDQPNHFGYVRFPAAVLVIFAHMFFAVTADPRRNRNLIPYGILPKAAYCGTVFGYWFSSGLPLMRKPFAVFDVVFAILFFWSWRLLGEVDA